LKKTVLSAAAAILSFLFVVGLLLMAVEIWCFHKAFYKSEYAKLQTAREIGISEEDLERATDALLDYLKGKREDLVVYADWNGDEREVFNEREKLHMEDVKILYQRAMLVGHLFFGAGAAFAVAALFVKGWRRRALEGYIRGNTIFFAMLALIGLYAALDFGSFWTLFHQLLFSNDLWLLDPATDVLIQMVPEQFFFDLVMRIALTAAVLIGGLFAGALLLRHRYRKGRMHDADETA